MSDAVQQAAAVRGPSRVPLYGAIIPIPTPAGIRLYRVFRSHEDRISLTPLNMLELAELAEALRAQPKRPRWRRAVAWLRRR